MSWLDAIERHARAAIGIPDHGERSFSNTEKVSGTPKPEPLQIAKPEGPKPELKTVWVQTAAPRDGNTGSAQPGLYSVTDGIVTMHDLDGKPNGKSRVLGPGDDPRKVAHDMTREAWQKRPAETDFNRRLDYRSESIA
jgi:hypothetical protein